MNKILTKIEEKIGVPGLVDQLSEKLSNSEMNSLLLALFERKTQKLSPSELLQQFSQNRFTLPSQVEPIPFKEYELAWLRQAQEAGFQLKTLSPLAPLGSCSAIARVSQHMVVSALRGTEAVSDATNVLALMIAESFKNNKEQDVIKYATTHRHVRGQYFTNPAFTAHFSVFCMVTGGQDTGYYSFELAQLADHLNLYLSFLSKVYGKEKLLVKFYLKEDNERFRTLLPNLTKNMDPEITLDIETPTQATAYYQLVQFKIFLRHKGQLLDMVDGGWVDWTQQLLQNKKHRLLISGAGIELLYKMNQGIL